MQTKNEETLHTKSSRKFPHWATIWVILIMAVFFFMHQQTVYALGKNKKISGSAISQSAISIEEPSENQLYFEGIPIGIVFEKESLHLQKPNHLRFSTKNETVDFMVDFFQKTPNTAWGTALYNSKYMKESAYVKNLSRKTFTWEGKRAHLYTFERKFFIHAPNLATHFLQIEIEQDAKTLISLHVKSKFPIDENVWKNKLRIQNKSNLEKQLTISLLENSETIFDKKTAPHVFTISKEEPVHTGVFNMKSNMGKEKHLHMVGRYKNKKRPFFHEQTKMIYEKEFGENSPMKWGVFEPTSNYTLSHVNNLQNKTGMDFKFLLEYYCFGDMPSVDHIKHLYNKGHILELTFQTSTYDRFNKDALYDILSGKRDTEIYELIDTIGSSDMPILFRLNNEMNGDWCNYNALYTHKDPDVFIEFWQWMRREFEKKQVRNVLWVWNPNWGDFPGVQWNHYLSYFPGVDYVDVVGLTGYNTGDYYPGEIWRSFSDIYMPMISAYKNQFLDFPFLITEFGCAVKGGDKPAWIDSALKTLKLMPIKGAIWWNGVDYDKDGTVARKYRFDDEPETLSIFKKHNTP